MNEKKSWREKLRLPEWHREFWILVVCALLVIVFSAMANASALSTQSVYVNPEGLIAYYPFDQCTGTSATDRGDWGNTGTLAGGANTTWVAGKYGCGINFNGGLNGKVSGTLSPSVANAGGTIGTWSVWFKANTFGGGIMGIGSTETPLFYSDTVASVTVLRGYWGGATGMGGGGTYAVSVNIIANTWYHAVFVSNGTYYWEYLNGVLVDSHTFVPANPATSTFHIGEYLDIAYFNGTIDEPKIWNRALSAEEIYVDYLGTYANIEKWYQGLSTGNITAVGANLTAFNQSINNTLNNLATNMSIFNSSVNSTLNALASNVSQLIAMQQSGNNNITLIIGNITNSTGAILGNMSGNYSYFDLLVHEVLGNETDIISLIGSYTINITVNETGGSNTTFNYTMPFNLTSEQARLIAHANWQLQYEQELQGYESNLEANQRLTLYISISILILLICISGYIIYYVVRRKRT